MHTVNCYICGRLLFFDWQPKRAKTCERCYAPRPETESARSELAQIIGQVDAAIGTREPEQRCPVKRAKRKAVDTAGHSE